VAQQGSPPPRPGRLPAASRQGESRASSTNSWDDPDGGDREYPPWAGLAPSPRRADHERPGHRAAGRSRRRARVIWVWGGAAIAVAVIVAALLFVIGGNPAGNVSPDGLVTTFQPGEFRTVPSACASVTPATLGQYLPGKRRMIAPHSLDGSAQSLCTWTVDAPPVYRVMEVTVQAYAPSALASGDGSATFAAIGAYQQALQAKLHPARDTHLPAATVTQLPGLGMRAFAALQVVRIRPGATDLQTVVARDHNVIVTVVFQAPHGNTGRYRPADPALLAAGAAATARDIVSQLH
jgi:hypothetical protein